MGTGTPVRAAPHRMPVPDVLRYESLPTENGNFPKRRKKKKPLIEGTFLKTSLFIPALCGG